jgi:hypothetical protein
MVHSIAGSSGGDVSPNISFSDVQRDLGLSSQELAAALGVSTRTVRRWRSGSVGSRRGSPSRKLEDLLLVHERVFEIIREDAGQEWLNTRRTFLGNLTPTEVIRAGRPDRVLELLTVIDHGPYA